MTEKRRNQDDVWEARAEALLGPEIARYYVIPKDVYKLLGEDASREALEKTVREYFVPFDSSADSAANAAAVRAAIDNLRRRIGNAAAHHTAHPTAIERKSSTARCRDVPRLGELILLCVLSKKARESLPGDLAEEFAEIVLQHGLRSARFWYWCQVVRSIGPLVRLGLVSSLIAWMLRQFGR